MLFDQQKYKHMFQALLEAEAALDEGEIPVGAVVVHEGKIIGRAHNSVERLKDPTAHAEILAITSAANALGDKFLRGCELFVTLEPCLMCAGAIMLSRIRTLYFGTFEPKFGASGSLYNVIEENRYNHKVEVYSGIYKNEAKNLLEEFFKRKRTTRSFGQLNASDWK